MTFPPWRQETLMWRMGLWEMTRPTSLRMTQTGESVSIESLKASRGPKEGSTSPSAIPFWNFPERESLSLREKERERERERKR